jgi:hypothetical protein
VWEQTLLSYSTSGYFVVRIRADGSSRFSRTDGRAWIAVSARRFPLDFRIRVWKAAANELSSLLLSCIRVEEPLCDARMDWSFRLLRGRVYYLGKVINIQPWVRAWLQACLPWRMSEWHVREYCAIAFCAVGGASRTKLSCWLGW